MSNEQEHAHFCHEIYYVVVNIYENPTGSFEEWKIAILKEKDLWKSVKLTIILCAVIAAAPRRGNWRTDAVAPPRKYCQLIGSM